MVRDDPFTLHRVAYADSDFLAGEDLDDLYFSLHGGYLDDDTDFHVELNTVVSEVAADKTDTTFRSDKSDNIC